MPVEHSDIIQRSRTNRSRVTNGWLLPGVDGRSAFSRRFHDLMDLLTHEVSGGEPLSASEAALIRQAALITVQTEEMQLAAARGEPVDGDELVRLSNVALRILGRLQRQRKDKPRGTGRHPSVLGLLNKLDKGGGT